MIVKFKSITITKSNLHKAKVVIEDEKGDAVIKSTIAIIIEDAEILPSWSLEDIIQRASEIAKREYLSR